MGDACFVSCLQVPASNSRPGRGVEHNPEVIDEHLYMPDEELNATFDSIYHKHTIEGRQQLPEGDPWKRKTSAFLSELVESHQNAQAVGRRSKRNLFIKLLKDAVIATLCSGSTGIEYVVRSQFVEFWHIIAKFEADVGRSSDGQMTDIYLVRFKASFHTDKDGKQKTFPSFCGMYPVERAYPKEKGHGPIHHVHYNFDQKVWEGTYFRKMNASKTKKYHERIDEREAGCESCRFDHD